MTTGIANLSSISKNGRASVKRKSTKLVVQVAITNIGNNKGKWPISGKYLKQTATGKTSRTGRTTHQNCTIDANNLLKV